MFHSPNSNFTKKQILAIVIAFVVDVIAFVIITDLIFAFLMFFEIVLAFLFAVGISESFFKAFYSDLPNVYVRDYKSGSSNINNKITSFRFFESKEIQMVTILMVTYLVFDLILILTLEKPFLITFFSIF